jgi:glycosyltransferase involved in cell wall biosynthesis
MNSRIKIVYVITSTGVGGAEKILYYTVTGLDSTKYSISLCSLKERGEIAKELEKCGVQIHCLRMVNKEGVIGWLSSIITLFRLFSYLRKLRPTIVHSFLFRANILARIAGYLTGVPIIISSIRVMGGEKEFFHFLERMTSFVVDRYVTVSESVKGYIIQKSKIPVEKVSVIYNGVNIKNCDSLQVQNVKLSFSREAGNIILMTVGRLHKQKGHYYLIHAISKVKKEVLKIRLLIIGEGEEEKNLKNLVKSLDLTDQIIFTGLKYDVENILPIAELFILPSLWEGMPNAVLEAMATGKPVVATEVGGIPELVIHGETGLLVPPKDSDALASAIIDLLQDKLKAKKMGEVGRIRVEEHFNISKTVEKTESLYQELLKEKQLL